MRISRVYTEQLLEKQSKIILGTEISHYLLKVLRMDLGSHLILFNGDNHSYNATICALKPLTVEIKQQEFKNQESNVQLHLIQGILRSDKMDLVIQKACELGVNEITPVFTQYTEIKLNKERLENKMQHWKKIIQSSCEQNGRNIIPTINQPQELTTLLNSNNISQIIVLDPDSTVSFSSFAQQMSKSNLNTIVKLTLLVGPEGGLHDNEISLAKKHGSTTVTLGKRILRTETAAIAALAAAQALLGDF